MQTQTEDTLKLDIAQVLHEKMHGYARYIPPFVVNWLSRTICQDQLNELLIKYRHLTGVDFATAVINDLNVKIEVSGIENIPANGKFIFASNHPLGGLDGMALISFLGNKYNGNLKFIVNDILMAIKPLSSVFLPINKHGRQSRENSIMLDTSYESDCQIVTFPAGLCSRNIKGDIIEDLKWQKGFITKSQKYHRDIIPVYFNGYNSKFFYRLGKIRRQLGIKINIEMIYLPSEVFKSRDKTYTIHFGKPIPWTTFDKSKTPEQWALEVKNIVYKLIN